MRKGISITPRRDPYHFHRLDPNAFEISRKEAVGYLLDPIGFAAAFSSIGHEDSAVMTGILPEHRRDLILALAGNQEARSRLLGTSLVEE